MGRPTCSSGWRTLVRQQPSCAWSFFLKNERADVCSPECACEAPWKCSLSGFMKCHPSMVAQLSAEQIAQTWIWNTSGAKIFVNSNLHCCIFEKGIVTKSDPDPSTEWNSTTFHRCLIWNLEFGSDPFHLRHLQTKGFTRSF